MLETTPPQLAQADTDELARLQALVSARGSYAEKVEYAKSSFKNKPRPLFERIRAKLESTAGDLVRCVYCEDSCADELEHIWPKNFYPERTYRADNYTFACGICNGAKNDKFSVYHAALWVDLIEHRKIHGVVTPPNGNSRFIDPITEDPMEFLWVDLSGNTFEVVPLHDEGTHDFERAEFTIKTLRLNRGILVKARENAYSGFSARIDQYIRSKMNGDAQDLVQSRLSELRRSPHQTIRHEMARQIKKIDIDSNISINHPEVFQ